MKQYGYLEQASGGEEKQSMKTAKERHNDRPDLFAPDGYEWEDVPTQLIDSMGQGKPMPVDFLPPPEELIFRLPKQTTTIRLDADVLEWFRSMGKGYQTKINAVLRAYKSAHQTHQPR
jgi:hypothetical protein